MKSVFVLIAALMMASSAVAQETPKAELFAGYSYAGTGSNGFDASIAANINKWFGVVADFGGQYSTFNDQGFTEKIRSHSYLFGPRVSLRKKRVTPFAHALFGGARVRTETDEFGPLLSFSDTSFAMALGGGLDVNVSEHVAIRAFQIDYLRTSFFGGTQNKGRIAAGIVFRFGKR